MNVDIAERLASRRKQAGLSQEGLAERLGVSRQAVSKWERSESSPDTDNLIALAKLYGVSLDELLYVDDSIEDDVEFEAADRASAQQGAQPVAAAGTATAVGGQPFAASPGSDFTASANANASAASAASAATGGEAGDAGKVHVGVGGIHVEDGKDYVHLSWRDGIHVIDEKGEEVHVGWSGIHVNDPNYHYDKASAQGQVRSGDATQRGEGAGTAGAAACADGERDSVSWDESGVNVNGEHFDSWHEAHAKYGHGHGFPNDRRWNEPCGYTVCGERFDTLEAARAKYGSGVGTTIPVKKHYLSTFGKVWLGFPYPLVAIVAYLLVGFMYDAWGTGLFIFFTVPAYYAVGHAIDRRQVGPLVASLYPLGVVAWFCYMAFVLNQPHPAWVAFLTIPIAEWAVHETSRLWRNRKRANDVIDVEAER